MGFAFEIVRRHKWIWLVPTALGLGWLMFSLLLGAIPAVQPGVHFKFTVPNGIPGVDNILQSEQVPIDAAWGSPLFLLSLVSMAISAFLSGGWLAGVFAALENKETTQEQYLEYSRHFFGRLLGARAITFLVMIFGLMTLAMILGPLAIIVLLVVLVYTFFWELAIVREDLSIGEGFARGHQLLWGNLGEVIGVAFPIALLTALISVVANLLAQSFIGYVLLIPVWSLVGGSFSVQIAALYDRLVAGGIPPAMQNPF